MMADSASDVCCHDTRAHAHTHAQSAAELVSPQSGLSWQPLKAAAGVPVEE